MLNYGGLPLPVDNFVNIGDSYTTTAFYATTLPEPCFHNAIRLRHRSRCADRPRRP
ncbi:MAG: hypothetical protein U1U88_001378 [Lawsonella clevelandensis]